MIRQLPPDPLVDPMGGVTLFARRIAVGLQNCVDEWPQRPDYRPLPLDRLAPRRLGAGQRLAHHPAMHAQLGRHPLNRSNAELVFPPDLLEQLHLSAPLHPQPPAPSAGCSAIRGWANLEHRSVPFHSIEINSESDRQGVTL